MSFCKYKSCDTAKSVTPALENLLPCSPLRAQILMMMQDRLMDRSNMNHQLFLPFKIGLCFKWRFHRRTFEGKRGRSMCRNLNVWIVDRWKGCDCQVASLMNGFLQWNWRNCSLKGKSLTFLCVFDAAAVGISKCCATFCEILFVPGQNLQIVDFSFLSEESEIGCRKLMAEELDFKSFTASQGV